MKASLTNERHRLRFSGIGRIRDFRPKNPDELNLPEYIGIEYWSGADTCDVAPDLLWGWTVDELRTLGHVKELFGEQAALLLMEEVLWTPKAQTTQQT